ncbi:hypothetical protein [Amycolatopsis magusensis]|uniref:Uncharacterized protein n=1 Tax=Amycolatopsis magusensis TaxID=882444 RepID=A0ABS4PJT6_9PSEU|nr:hypothetical protein [Amycolatopsis magusensis]MBP2179689.1 hypothetical protein [Amycolatopsis magusensis]
MLLTEFCTRLPELRRRLKDGDRVLVEQAVLAARDGKPVDAKVSQLLGPGVQLTEVYGPSTGVNGAFLCPTGKCGRVVYRRAGDELPVCPLFERDLRFVADG